MRKNFLLLTLAATTLGALGGCATTTQEQTAACADAGATVRTVTDVAGMVSFDQALQQWPWLKVWYKS